jgi:hypothetical protein
MFHETRDGIDSIKIIITGTRNAGKSEFIRTAVGNFNVSVAFPSTFEQKTVDLGETSVIFEQGRTVIGNNLELNLTCIAGLEWLAAFDSLLPGGIHGFIVVVDSTRPQTFRETRNIIESYRACTVAPCVVAANKQDLQDAWEIDTIRQAIRLYPYVKLLPCIATRHASVVSVINALLDSVLADGDSEE